MVIQQYQMIREKAPNSNIINSSEDDVSYNKLLQVIRQSPSRQWIEEYLDLVKELIEFTELDNNDPRLVISLPMQTRFPVTINRRYVLSAFRKGKPSVGFIFPYDFEQLPKLLDLAIAPEFSSHQYDPHYGEIAEQTPYFLDFEGSPKELLTLKQKLAWKQAIISEVERGRTSPYKKHHESMAYKTAIDPNYRALVLDKAFPDSQLSGRIELNLSTIKDTWYELPELNTERKKIETEGYFNVENLEDARQRVTASIVQRQGQSEFRRKLLNAYGGQCPITGCDVEPAIEAAHIIPYQGAETNHPTNGLPLRADIHTLFDLHLLSIQPDTYEVVIAPELVKTCYQEFAGRRLALPQKQMPNKIALSKHYEIFIQKRESNWKEEKS